MVVARNPLPSLLLYCEYRVSSYIFYLVTHGVYSCHECDLRKVKTDCQIETDLHLLHSHIPGNRIVAKQIFNSWKI